ncbi:MAG: hypothetical protein QW734_06450 [Candidatus Bathyarchaeia archaeon]
MISRRILVEGGGSVSVEADVRSSPTSEKEREEYNEKIRKLLEFREEKPLTEEEKKKIEQRATELNTQAQKSSQNALSAKMLETWIDASNTFLQLPSAEQKKYNVEAAQKFLGGDPLGSLASILQGIVAGFVDRVKTIADGIATFGRGVVYGIIGPPENEDLSDEIAAVKGTGLGLMAGAPPAAAVAAATGVGAPVAAAIGSLGLLGWGLVDNIAGRLEFIQSQRESEKKKERERLQNLEDYKKKMDMWLETTKAAEEIKKEAREELNRYYEELNAKRELSEEEKRREEEEERAFYALINALKAKIEEIKTHYALAQNAYYAKNQELALSELDKALELVKFLETDIEINKVLLEKFGYYVSLVQQASSILNMINAMKKVYSGLNPNRDLQNAAIKYNEAVGSFWSQNRKTMYRNQPVDLGDKDQRKIVVLQYSQATNDEAIAKLITDVVSKFADMIKFVAYPASKLSYMTIAKFRDWIARTYKTPLSAIPNYVWNRCQGRKYNADMLLLMLDALEDAGVDPEEVRELKPYELEAILRARQYLWAAAQRGYFYPYELELYTRLKELLQLTDSEAADLLQIPSLVLKPRVPKKALEKYKPVEELSTAEEVTVVE